MGIRKAILSASFAERSNLCRSYALVALSNRLGISGPTLPSLTMFRGRPSNRQLRFQYQHPSSGLLGWHRPVGQTGRSTLRIVGQISLSDLARIGDLNEPAFRASQHRHWNCGRRNEIFTSKKQSKHSNAAAHAINALMTNKSLFARAIAMVTISKAIKPTQAA